MVVAIAILLTLLGILLMVRMHKQKINLIYKFDSVDSDLGIDVFQAGPLLTSFGELIKEANRLVGSHPSDIGINIKPAEKGSFIQEFIIYAPSLYQSLTTLIDKHSVEDLKTVIEWLGIINGAGVSVFHTIKFLNGKWSKIEEAGPNEYKYFTDDGQSITVNGPVHTLIQSPVIQENIKNVFYAIPKSISPEDISISTYETSSPEKTRVTFNEEDIESIGVYSGQELSDIGKETIAAVTTLYLKPKHGSYKGDRGPYSFFNGKDIVSPVTIEDEDFLILLNSGEVRLHADDVLKVRLRTEQKVTANNDIYVHHFIEKVLEYRRGDKLQQQGLFDENQA